MKNPIEFYKDAKGDIRWRMVAANGRIIGASTEGYKNLDDAWDNLVQVTRFGVVLTLDIARDNVKVQLVEPRCHKIVSIDDHMAEEYGYVHFDLENFGTFAREVAWVEAQRFTPVVGGYISFDGEACTYHPSNPEKG